MHTHVQILGFTWKSRFSLLQLLQSPGHTPPTIQLGLSPSLNFYLSCFNCSPDNVYGSDYPAHFLFFIGWQCA